jgi:predicted dienelactone hydrolase
MRLLAVIVAICLVSPVAAREAGFEQVTTPQGVEVGIWYPAEGPARTVPIGAGVQTVVPDAPLPAGQHALVVISHGTGGAFSSHADTAVALARAGFIVAALTHPGDNWRDQSKASTVEDRPRALSALIDYMLTDWRGHGGVDAGHIAAFGFSSGGFTVLAAAGGRPDLSLVAGHCAAHPAWFDCRLLASHPRGALPVWTQQGDPRIKALVVAAPALGFTFGRTGLAGVTIPVQLWRADSDEILPAPDYADAVREALPRSPEFHGVPNAGHFDFLLPCLSPDTVPVICRSAPGFDRTAFHRDFNEQVVRFLSAAMSAR